MSNKEKVEMEIVMNKIKGNAENMESEKKILEVELKTVQKNYNKISNTIDTTTCLTVENTQ
eukprot:6052649-Ditylum_brightwellii.AAC.1